jgi:Do/DeqQ family serine protease
MLLEFLALSLMKRFLAVVFVSASTSAAVVYCLRSQTNPVPTADVDRVEDIPTMYTGLANQPSPQYIPDFTSAAAKTLDAVVHIKTMAQVRPVAHQPFQDFFFGHPQGQQRSPIQSGSGSGVIIRDDGYIITNNHVVANADQIEVVLNDKRSYVAKLIGADPKTDLAVLKITGDQWTPMSFSNSDEAQVGQWVLAIGNPFNLASTVTAGIVSAKGRNIDIIQENFKIESFIQTDAAVNPGNSGGALVNLNGELVGINTAIASNTGSYAGYSFAIPANLARKVAIDLIEFGNVQRAFMGVNIRDVDQALAQAQNLSRLKGVYVDGVMNGSSAEAGGLEPGDLIIAVDSFNIESTAALQERLGLHRPGDAISLGILRGSRFMRLSIVLKNKLGTTELLTTEHEIDSKFGGQLRKGTLERLRGLGISHGVEVKNVAGGLLSHMGLQAGFVITEMNGTAISQPQDMDALLDQSPNRFYIGGFYRKGEKRFYSYP